MADARDLKSRDCKKSCGFESRHRHQDKPSNSMNTGQFTTRAALLWATIPQEAREQILANVFCGNCRDSVQIVKFTGLAWHSVCVDGLLSRVTDLLDQITNLYWYHAEIWMCASERLNHSSRIGSIALSSMEQDPLQC